MEILNWIEKWFLSQCDGGWEHSYSIKIESLDNPGWGLTIDIAETVLHNLIIPYKLIENSANDWYGIKVENQVFEAYGDPMKLEFLLLEFKKIAEINSSGVQNNESFDPINPSL